MKYNKIKQAILNTEIHKVGLSERAINAFCRGYTHIAPCDKSDLFTVNDLYRAFIKLDKKDFTKMHGVGEKCYEEYRIILNELGLEPELRKEERIPYWKKYDEMYGEPEYDEM